jgi:hypothetical protein
MSARIAPEPIGNVNTGISDYRPRGAPEVPTAAQSKLPAPEALLEIEIAAAAAAEPPPLPEPAAPGTAFVMAVLSGALAPRPTSMQEVFLRTGTGWVPPDSDYRLADKKI